MKYIIRGDYIEVFTKYKNNNLEFILGVPDRIEIEFSNCYPFTLITDNHIDYAEIRCKQKNDKRLSVIRIENFKGIAQTKSK